MSTYFLSQRVYMYTSNGTTSIIDQVFLWSNPTSLLSRVTLPSLSTSDHKGFLTLEILAVESTPAGIPSEGMLMLIGRQHVSLLTTLTGTHDINLFCSNWQQQFMSIIEDCIPKGFSPMQNLPCLCKNLISAMRKRNPELHKVAISLNISLHATVLYVSNSKTNSQYLLPICIQLCKLTLEKLTFWTPLSSPAIICHTHPWIQLNITIYNHLMGVLRSFYVIITRRKSISYMSTLDFIKANGPNGISTGMLKHTAASITPSITLICLCVLAVSLVSGSEGKPTATALLSPHYYSWMVPVNRRREGDMCRFLWFCLVVSHTDQWWLNYTADECTWPCVAVDFQLFNMKISESCGQRCNIAKYATTIRSPAKVSPSPLQWHYFYSNL